MKATLYEALGIPQLAPDEEVRAALRRLIRKYYAKTRDGQGNVEEALRFINHASRILSDPEHRQHYDQELAVTAEANTEQRISRFVSNVAGTVEQGTATHDDDEIIEAADEKILTSPVAAPEKSMHHPGLTERVASFGRSRLGQLALCLLFGAFIAGAIVFVTPADSVLVAKQVLVWLTLALLVLSLVYGVVHGLSFVRRGRIPRAPALIPQTDLAILNWRREKSVFLGTDAPQEDASWIFQLRMAELERAKSGRTSEPRPWNRLAARLFDYAIWGLVLALLLSELHGAGIVGDSVAFWLGHPLFAPVLITLTWIPIEALLIASLQQTPGKWLFGVYLQFSISNAYARRDVRAQLQRALRRSFHVWWAGVACGFPLLAPVLIALASLVYGLIESNQRSFTDGLVLGCFAAAAVLLVAFVIVERRIAHPMFDLKLFMLPTFSGGSVAAFGLSASMFSLLLYLVLYLQDILGYSALATGLRLLVLSGGILGTSTIAGRLSSRVPVRLLIGPGLLLVGIGILLMRGLDATST